MSTVVDADRRPPRGRAVLIEDVAADRALLEAVLMEQGFEPLVPERTDVDAASLGPAAPRVIVLSVDVKNGFNLCLRFKKDPVLRGVPLVLTTGKASPEVIRKHRLLPTRADAYVMKPLGREALLQALREVFPDDFPGTTEDVPAPVEEAAADHVETEISEIVDRTLVSPGQLEKAVVDYVEDEVRTLRTAVERLMNEKSDVSHLRVLVDTEGMPPPPPAGLSDDEVEARLEEARAEGYREGLEAGRAERRTRGIEQARREAEAAFNEERDALDARAAELEDRAAGLEKQVKALDAQARAADGRFQAAEARANAAEAEVEALRAAAEERTAREAELRAELDQNTLLFERLEAGYKDALAKSEADKAAAQEAVAAAEVERDAQVERLNEMKEALQALEAALAERNTHCETLEEDCATMRRRLEASTAAGARVAELELEKAALAGELEDARKSSAELEEVRKGAEEARAEVERLKARLDRVREALEGDA